MTGRWTGRPEHGRNGCSDQYKSHFNFDLIPISTAVRESWRRLTALQASKDDQPVLNEDHSFDIENHRRKEHDAHQNAGQCEEARAPFPAFTVWLPDPFISPRVLRKAEYDRKKLVAVTTSARMLNATRTLHIKAGYWEDSSGACPG
ncbi:MAG: hypothetical protein ABI885_16915 [Gammaproteobacteria bacterium]